MEAIEIQYRMLNSDDLIWNIEFSVRIPIDSLFDSRNSISNFDIRMYLNMDIENQY